jgi:hypothetical protein
LIIPALTITAGLLSAFNPPLVRVNLTAQTADEEPKNIKDTLYKKRFPGGADAFTRFISKNIHYPRLAQEAIIPGAATAQFKLSPDGSVKDIKVINADREDMGKEVERLLNMLPKFDAVSSRKTKTILFTVVFLMRNEQGKTIGPDPYKLKADVFVTGDPPLH